MSEADKCGLSSPIDLAQVSSGHARDVSRGAINAGWPVSGDDEYQRSVLSSEQEDQVEQNVDRNRNTDGLSSSCETQRLES